MILNRFFGIFTGAFSLFRMHSQQWEILGERILAERQKLISVAKRRLHFFNAASCGLMRTYNLV